MRTLLASLLAGVVLLAAGCSLPFLGEPPPPDCCAPPPDAQGLRYDAVRFEQLRTLGRGPLPRRELHAGDTLRDLVGPRALVGIDPALPVLKVDHRRFAVVMIGCNDANAVLIVSGSILRPRLVPHTPQPIACDAAEYYVAVFDVPARVISGPVRWDP